MGNLTNIIGGKCSYKMDNLQNVKLENINISKIRANILFMLFLSWNMCHLEYLLFNNKLEKYFWHKIKPLGVFIVD